MASLLKRLAANEIGGTQGHQEGGILIPKNCVDFFPALTGDQNPELSVDLRFQHEIIRLRLVYYNNKHWKEMATQDEYRLTPMPRDLFRNASARDVFILSEGEDGIYDAAVVSSTSQEELNAYISLRSGVQELRVLLLNNVQLN
ncbi:MAG: EcoRII N-terminal effector-binding domain-containing protein [Phycisphaerales bacterium]